MKKVKLNDREIIEYTLDESKLEITINELLFNVLNDEELVLEVSKSLIDYQSKKLTNYVKNNLSTKIQESIIELIKEAELFLEHSVNDSVDIDDNDCSKAMLIRNSIKLNEIKKIQQPTFNNICTRLEAEEVNVISRGREVKYTIEDLFNIIEEVNKIEKNLITANKEYKSITNYNAQITKYECEKQELLKFIHEQLSNRNNNLYLACEFVLKSNPITGLTARALEEKILKLRKEDKQS